MASMWRKAMIYLGLGPDDEYDDFEEAQPRAQPPRRQPAAVRAEAGPEPVESGGSVRTITPVPVAASPVERSTVTARPTPGPVVRPIAPQVSARPQVLSPTSFNQAQEIADRFKEGLPVIVNMQSLDRDLARRLIDFASGLCYGLSGHMERVAQSVYLLTPSNVEVSAEEKRRLQERGLHD
ncbi:MAG: cell division protein SepF [Acidimicrobiales bacterium]|nr:cell division protein SepF [Acidimicrobiales bacterium]